MATLEELVKKYADKHGVPADLFYALVGQESAGKNGRTSTKDAMGLSQIIPSTFEAQSKKIGLKNADVWNPEHNLDVGASYLKEQLVKYGDTATALAAYNAGPGAVDKYGGIPPYRETRNYVAKIRENISKARSKLESGSATPIVDVRTGGTYNSYASSASSASSAYADPSLPSTPSTARQLPAASDYAGINSEQLNQLAGYLEAVRGTVNGGNQQLRAIDNQRMAQMQELLTRVNYDPMNPNSIGSRNVAELARLSAVQRATEQERERVGRAGLFDDPAAYIEKTLFGNPYVQGAKDNMAALDRLSAATGKVDERIKSQADMAKDAYLADPAVVRAEMAAALQLADIEKEVGIAKAEAPLKLEELQIKRFNAETDATNSSTSAQRQQLALEQDRRLVEQQAAEDAALKDIGLDRASLAAAKLQNEALATGRSITANKTAIDQNTDVMKALDDAAKLRTAGYVNKVNEARAAGEVGRLDMTLQTDSITAFSEYLKAGTALASDKIANSNIELNAETVQAKMNLDNIQATGALGRAQAVESIKDIETLTAAITSDEAYKDAGVQRQVGDLKRLSASLEAQVKAVDAQEAKAQQTSSLELARKQLDVNTKIAEEQGKKVDDTIELRDKALVGAVKLGKPDATAATLLDMPPESLKALATVDRNGYAGANSYQSYATMQALGVAGESNAGAPKVGQTWLKLQAAVMPNMPEGLTSRRDQEAWFAGASQDVFVTAANSQASGKTIDSSASLRSESNVYSLPSHEDIVAAGLSESTANVFSQLDASVLKNGSAAQLIDALYESPAVVGDSIINKAAAKKAVSVAVSEYMKKGMEVANRRNGYEKLGLPKMTSKHLTVSVPKTTDITGIGAINVVYGDMKVDLTDPAQVAKLIISKDLFNNSRILGQ